MRTKEFSGIMLLKKGNNPAYCYLCDLNIIITNLMSRLNNTVLPSLVTHRSIGAPCLGHRSNPDCPRGRQVTWPHENCFRKWLIVILLCQVLGLSPQPKDWFLSSGQFMWKRGKTQRALLESILVFLVFFFFFYFD